MSVLLLFLIAMVALAAPPSDEQIEGVYEENPSAIYDMVRKLYVVEKAEPEILLPTLVIAELKNGSAVVDFQGPLVITIGDAERNLQYSTRVQATDAIVADSQSESIGAGWVVAGGLLVFVGGAITGALIFQ